MMHYTLKGNEIPPFKSGEPDPIGTAIFIAMLVALILVAIVYLATNQ
jgi:hypothetical protein